MKNLFKNLIIPVIIVLGVALVFFTKDPKKIDTQNKPITEQIQNVNVDLTVDYTDQKPKESKSVTIEQEKTAWDVLQKAVGTQNIEFKDYGQDLGIFVSAINGIKPTGDKFWLFKVNGQGAKVGVSSYKVKNGDKLEFIISEPEKENQ